MTEAELTRLLSIYRPSDVAVNAVRSAKIVLLVGISGAGKNTLQRELLKHDSYNQFISHTTRAPRSNEGVMEQDGADYYFITTEEAIRMLNAGEYIEAKKVHSNIYGTTIDGLARAAKNGHIAVNDVDVQGVEEYKRISPGIHAIFVLPPSYEEWNRRRLARYENSIDPKDNQVRLESAKSELEFALSKGFFDFVINDDITTAAEHVRRIVDGLEDGDGRNRGVALARELHRALSTH